MNHRVPPVVVAVMAAVVFTTGVVAAVLDRGDDGPPHPEAWDPRVLDLVAFNEEHRGLKFEEPVFVDFLDAQAYSERIRIDTAQVTDEDRRQLENAEGELRALGLMKGDVDLLEAGNDLVDTGTLAFYDPVTERITVRGTEVTVSLRVTLVHELVHVLQDQHFGVGADRVEGFETSQQSSAFRAVLEGDAVRIENEYIDSLSEADRAEYEQDHQADIDTATTGLSEVPAALQAFQAAPYLFGPSFMTLRDAIGGQERIDEALREPPTTEEQLVDPRVFEERLDALTIDTPFLREGVLEEAIIDEGDLGWVTWYVFLAERIDPIVALQAADGWGGDAYVAYKEAGATCMNIAWQGDTSADDQEMRDALQQWITAMPPGPTVEEENDLLLLHTCDPGEASGLEVANRALDTIQLPAVRSALLVEVVQSLGDDLDEAFALSDCVTRAIPLEEIIAVNKGEKPAEELQGTVQRATIDCQPR